MRGGYIGEYYRRGYKGDTRSLGYSPCNKGYLRPTHLTRATYIKTKNGVTEGCAGHLGVADFLGRRGALLGVLGAETPRYQLLAGSWGRSEVG